MVLVMVLIHEKTCWRRYELQPREEWSLLTALSVYMAMLLMIMQQEGYDSLNFHFADVNCFVLFVCVSSTFQNTVAKLKRNCQFMI